MKRYLTVAASFIIMTALGGIYAWSLAAYELIKDYDFTSSQTQLIFGTLICVYPFVFIGYAISGITGPLAGGLLFDSFDDFSIATTLAAVLSLAGDSIFLIEYLRE